MRLLQAILEPPAHPQHARWLNAGPDVVLALLFLITWIAPFTFGANTTMNLMLVLIFEFIILHSAAVGVTLLLGRFGQRSSWGLLVGLSLFYLLFAGGFALATGAWWTLWTFALLTLNRITTMRQQAGLEGAARLQVIVTWALTFAGYVFVLIFLSVLPVPRLGVDHEVIALVTAKAGGSMAEEPHRTLAMGFCYFLGVALAEATGLYARLTRRLLHRIDSGIGFLSLIFALVNRSTQGFRPPSSGRP